MVSTNKQKNQRKFGRNKVTAAAYKMRDTRLINKAAKLFCLLNKQPNNEQITEALKRISFDNILALRSGASLYQARGGVHYNYKDYA